MFAADLDTYRKSKTEKKDDIAREKEDGTMKK